MDETLLSNQYLKKQVSDMKEREKNLNYELKQNSGKLKVFTQNNNLLKNDIRQTKTQNMQLKQETLKNKRILKGL